MTAKQKAALPPEPLLRIAVQPIQDPDNPLGVYPGRWTPIDIRQVAYMFLASAATRGLIDPALHRSVFLRRSVVYLRTRDGGLFRTTLRQKELRARLGGARFVWIQRMLLVNIDAVKVLDFAGSKTGLIGVEAGSTLEYLPVARRRVSILRRIFGFPKHMPS